MTPPTSRFTEGDRVRVTMYGGLVILVGVIIAAETRRARIRVDRVEDAGGWPYAPQPGDTPVVSYLSMERAK